MRTPSETDSCGGDPWIVAIRDGRFEDAWRISDDVMRARAGVPCFHLPRHEQYLWNGAPLAGRRVLVRCYHGLGDTVQFIRYTALLRTLAREVIVWAQPCLIPLLRSAAGIDRLLPLHDGMPDVDYDEDVEVMELPHVFRTTLQTIPATVPYLVPDAPPGHRVASDRRRRRHAGVPWHVGLVWQSGGWDERRSIPTRLLPQLIATPGVVWHALQQGPALRDWRSEWGTVSATDDVVTLARRMLDLDLVVSVDSFPVHLAGALGVPTWTLLHADPDWRWMSGRSDSPWYPTMRLWRQPTPGNWPAVLGSVARALERVSADDAARQS